ncbi:PAS-domain containing protein [Roseibium sediminicola]|uniref:histidine kinase n=1 Tax=Roseibium sediminicola TaxID=2933272 RepID=A0ABT0H062_9HYPH|nr:PAS-domain containing protein [Roseibium sp. CAU 1639]MCK7615077.1 PAS-domain containing protein [Roseibium sp. CAU 1639]
MLQQTQDKIAGTGEDRVHRQLLEEAVDALREGFALFDDGLRFQTCNARFLDLFNLGERDRPVPGAPAQAVLPHLASGAALNAAGIPAAEVFLQVLGEKSRDTELWLANGRVLLLSATETRHGGTLLSILDDTERRQAASADRASADLLKTVIEACPANLLMSRFDDGKVLFRSSASETLFGGQETARSHWQDLSQRDSYLEALRRNGRVDDMFVEGKRADGTVFPSQLSARLIRYRGEDVIVSTTIDLTEAYALRAETDRANASLRGAVEALEEGFVLYDRDKKLVFANSRYADMLGPHKRLLVPGTPMQEIIGSAIGSGHISFVRGPEGGLPGLFKTLDTKGSLKVEIEVADGSQREITLARLAEGGIVATVLDITQQRTAEARARALMHGAIEGVDFGIALVDDDERLVFANAKFREIGDPNGDLLVPGRTMREIHAGAISTGLFPLPPWTPSKEVLDELDRMIRHAAKGFSVPNNQGREIVGNVYETALQGRLLTIEDVTDQLRAERLFTDAVARLPVGVAIEGADGRFTHCNDAFAAPFHLTADEILNLSGDERIDVLSPEIATVAGQPVGGKAAQLFGEAVKRQRDTLAPMEVSFRNGRHYLVERAITQDNGRVVVVTDITALKEAESRSLQTLNDAIQSLDEGLVLFDRDLNFVLGNKLYDEMFFSRIVAPDPGENLNGIMDRLIDAGVMLVPEGVEKQAYMAELDRLVRHYAKKETITLGNGRVFLASAHQTELDGFLVSFIDITEQRRAEEEQREADLLLRKIVEACPANFLVSRIEDGKIIYCPPASRERFGKIDSTLSFFLSPDDRRRYLDALLPTGELDDYRVQFRRADGSIMEGLTAARVTDYKGENVIVSSTRDISDLLAMQDELQKQRDIAHQSEKLSALGELLAGVAHELNNPLSIIVGYAQMLEGRLEDPVLSKRVDRIAEAANRSARIVKTFLAMARQRPALIEPCSLNEIATIALDVAGYGLRANGTHVVTRLDEDLPAISGDADQLIQVVSNLIVNAEHALAPQGQAGTLTLASSYDVDSDRCVLEVSDNGPGIAEDILARIFEPFFTTKEVGEGTGVGLAFSHRIIDTHGGLLEVTSTPGEGTRFFVKLKAVKPEAGEAPETAAPGEGLDQKRVLVVDDEADVGELISDLLTDLGCRATRVTDAREALSLLSRSPFDLILSDFKMPGMDGEAFFKVLQERLPSYTGRIGFITGDSMGKAVDRFLAASGRPFIEKPILKEDLANLVRTLSGGDQTS